MRTRIIHLLLLLGICASLAGGRLLWTTQTAQAQGYSGAMPNVLTPASGLVVTYTSGIVASGGLQQAITGSTVTVSNTQTDCSAPAYASCNFVFWAVGGGTSLSTSTSSATAFAPGNVVVAFVTATGGNVSAVTPSSWMPATAAVTSQPGNSNNTAGSYWVPPGACYYGTSGGTLTAQTNVGVAGATGLGLVTSGTSNTPVIQIATTSAGTATNSIICVLNPPANTLGITGRGINVTSVTATYGVQQTGLGTQATVGASGTMNAVLVFSKITLPADSASETPSTVAPVRADAGTLGFSSLANVATTTAGAFVTFTATPATAVALTTDRTTYLFTMTFLCTATSATTINSMGLLVRYTS